MMDLQTFFTENNKVALAFSGGTDSSYLLFAAMHYGAQVKTYYIHTAFQPEFELEDAKRLAEQLHADMEVIEMDALADPQVAANPENRCYYCKINLFRELLEHSKKDGYSVLIDGTNASDDAGDRPGMRALEELAVRSPLRECQLSKEEIRKLSKEAGLFTWNKPAYACLATRIPAGNVITEEILSKVEDSENFLFSLGYTDFRVRVMGENARLQLPENQMQQAINQRKIIIGELKKYFKAVLLDMESR
ncbi:MAG: ATP-dependent sacrificial sulfur transferase LarE [Mobilitalea sp.]